MPLDVIIQSNILYILNTICAKNSCPLLMSHDKSNTRSILMIDDLDCIHTMPAHFENGEKCER